MPVLVHITRYITMHDIHKNTRRNPRSRTRERERLSRCIQHGAAQRQRTFALCTATDLQTPLC